MILRRRAQHRRATDVDVLDRVIKGAIGFGDGGLERIQVHYQQVDRRDPVFGHHLVVQSLATEQAAVNSWMQGLDAAVHDFGEAGDLADIGDFDA